MGTQTVQLSGTGAAAPTDTVSTASLVFATTAAGQVSTEQTVTITNSGDLPLHVNSVAVSAGFQESSNCLNGVAAHANCAISVAFAPSGVGAITGSLTISDELGIQPVQLSGTGVAPGFLSVNPASLTYSTEQPGVQSAPQTVTITNAGGAPLANIGLQLIGAAAASYAIVSSTCPAQLNAGAQCAVQIAFTPATTGPIGATLAVSTSTAGVAAAQVQLNGSGLLTAGLTASPGVLTFANAVGVGQTSSAQALTITNTSGYGLSGLAVAITGPFSISSNNCADNLPVGARCTLGILFQPTVTGTTAGSVSVTSSSISSPVSVVLAGTGFDFAVQASGSTKVTISSGQQADYKLVITPAGAQGTFSFQCGSLPTNALCMFSPATETIATGVQGNVEVQIYTGSSGLSAQAVAARLNHDWPFALAILVLPFGLLRGRKLLLMIVLGFSVMCGMTSCTSAIGGTTTTSSNSSGQSNSSATPAGTYSVPVTVISTGISHTITLTLTVD
jgi:hypothetical protein